MNKNISFEKESPDIVERYELIKNIGDRKIINDLEVFHSLGIDKSIKGVTTLLKYQPPLFEGKLFLMGEDIKEVELAIKRLMVKVSLLSMSWSNKVYVIKDGDIILKIDGDASMMIFEMKDNYLTLSSYVNRQAFEN
ncbi:hypothetical protein [Photobacterium sp. Hal280]|uniref:hypothetical protein n=1 Tax=Photobacterium sp. Hal280 TaxID=3035163 RepID=UPI00301E4D93